MRAPTGPLPSPGWTERLLLLAAISAFFAGGYLPLSQAAARNPGPAPVTWVDGAIPLGPSWVFVYTAVLFTVYLPAVVVRDRYLFRRVVLAFAFAMSVAFATFALWPVAMPLRPQEVEVTSFATWGLRVYYWADAPGACLPSLHVALATLAALCCWKVDRPVGAVALVLAVAVGASTLFVKQHLLADVVTGFALGAVAWTLYVRPYRVAGIPRFHRGFALAVAASYLAVLLGAMGLYRLGWEPWDSRDLLALQESPQE